jgi:hypothetical protein
MNKSSVMNRSDTYRCLHNHIDSVIWRQWFTPLQTKVDKGAVKEILNNELTAVVRLSALMCLDYMITMDRFANLTFCWLV